MVWLARSIFTTTEASARSQQSPQAKSHPAMAVAQSNRRIAIPQHIPRQRAGNTVAPPRLAKKWARRRRLIVCHTLTAMKLPEVFR